MSAGVREYERFAERWRGEKEAVGEVEAIKALEEAVRFVRRNVKNREDEG